MHLLVAHRTAHHPADRSREAARLRAEGLLARARRGEPLSALAAEHTDEPYGAHSEGRMRIPVDLPFEPLAGAQDLPVGGLGEVVESGYGFHLVQRLG